jgi:PAS domain S-box-containing protein
MPKPLSPDIIEEATKFMSEHSQDLLAVWSLDGTCRLASPSHLAILGYEPAEVEGQTWQKFIAQEDHAHVTLAGEDAILNDQSIEFSFIAIAKSGARVALRGISRFKHDATTNETFFFINAYQQQPEGHKSSHKS